VIRPKHIRTHLALWYSAILGGILITVALGVSLFFLHGLREEFDRTLSESFERGARHLEISSTGLFGMRKPEPTPKNPNRDFANEIPIEVFSSSGEHLYQSAAWKNARLSETAPGNFSERFIKSIQSSAGERFRVVTGHHSIGTQDLVVRVAASEERIWHEVWELVSIFLFAIPVALILSGIAGYWMAAKALRPVEIMSRRAQAISAENLNERLPVQNPEDELGALATVINSLLTRVEKSFEELKRFTSDASHELRTPLQALRSVGEVALQSEQSSKYYREVISSMLEETDRMSKLTQSLLSLSRADSGNFKLNRTPTDLNSLVKEVNNLLEPLAEEKKQSLITGPAEEAQVNIDPVVFRQAVMNLVDNAIKYSPRNSQILSQVSRDNGSIIIEVRDQGPGIPLEHREKIFQRFYRVDKSRSRELGGAGLGLAITKWAVESHGGTLELKCDPTGGSVFRICLDESVGI
jgi:heavy metal sensor kinase